MSFTIAIVIILAIGTIVSAILLLKQSAKKFDLTKEQLQEIKTRNKALDKEEKKED